MQRPSLDFSLTSTVFFPKLNPKVKVLEIRCITFAKKKCVCVYACVSQPERAFALAANTVCLQRRVVSMTTKTWPNRMDWLKDQLRPGQCVWFHM